MKWTIRKAFTFEAAHYLPHVPDGHKCKRLHGHSYGVEVRVSGDLKRDGMVVDYADISQAWMPVREELDHRCLNDIDGLDNPTCEILARWIYKRLSADLAVSSVSVQETAKAGVTYGE